MTDQKQERDKFMNVLDEFDYLIHLVGCTLNGTQPQELPSGMDFANIFKLAKQHEIANLAFYSIDKLKNKPEPSLYEKWSAVAQLCFTRDINQQFAHDEIIREFKKANIRSLEAQGTIVKKYYTESYYRTMSDIDLLIDQCNFSKAETVLQNLGYTLSYPFPNEVHAFRRPNIHIEIHCKLMNHEIFKGFLDNAFDVSHTDDGLCYLLDDNDFYLYNLFHLIKHYLNTGCGIRRICDIFILNRALSDKLDSNYINEECDKYGVRDLAEKVLRLSNVWFGNDEMTSDLNEVAQQIKDSGTHGNRIVGLRNEIRKNAGKSKFGFVLRRVFPKCSEMYTIYPKLQNRKILIPLYYLYRPFHLIIFKRKATIIKLKEIMK